MATEKDYAILSAYVYNDARGPKNRITLPSIWDKLPISASDTTSGFAALFTGGFSAGAFRNKATGEIVVVYKGTDLNLRLGTTADNELEVFFQGEQLDVTEVAFAPKPLEDGGILVEIPETLVTPGELHLLCVRCDNSEGPGGMAFLNPGLYFGPEKLSLEGRWQFRLGDDESFATLPLPAKFAAPTEAVFELKP